jgi:DNA-binding NtrC family response regulator
LAKVDGQLADRQILIVEDELIIAWELQAIVEALGASVLGPAASVSKALALLSQQSSDAAILDINLQGQIITPVAKECERRNVPFAVVTGYGRLHLDEPLLEVAPRVRKPFNRGDIAAALNTLLIDTPGHRVRSVRV